MKGVFCSIKHRSKPATPLMYIAQKNHVTVHICRFLLRNCISQQHQHRKYTAISRKVVGKVHATIPKGIVGGFEFFVLQRNLKRNGMRENGRMFASAKGKQQ